jgi:hypothetical protein
LCAILFFITIYLLAARKFSGWWLGIIAASSILVIDIPTQIIRTVLTDSSSLDYLMGAGLAAGLLFSLLFPKFKAVLIDQESQVVEQIEPGQVKEIQASPV